MLKHIPFYASLFNLGNNSGIKPTNGHILLYGAVETHSFGAKGCIASNKTLAEETGLKASSVSVYLSEMSKMGWIKVCMNNGQRKNIEPLLCIAPPLTTVNAPLNHSYTPPLTTVKQRQQYKGNRENKGVGSSTGQLATPQRVEDGVAFDDINDVFKAFDQIKDDKGEGKYSAGNKTKSWWGDKTKHYNSKINFKQAAAELIKKYGKEDVIETISWVDLRTYPIYEYLPYTVTVNNPVELLEKWDKIKRMVEAGSEAYYKKHPEERPDFSFLN